MPFVFLASLRDAFGRGSGIRGVARPKTSRARPRLISRHPSGMPAPTSRAKNSESPAPFGSEVIAWNTIFLKTGGGQGARPVRPVQPQAPEPGGPVAARRLPCSPPARRRLHWPWATAFRQRPRRWRWSCPGGRRDFRMPSSARRTAPRPVPPAGPAIPAPAARFPSFNWPVYWIIGRLCLFLLPLFCYAYLTGAIILMVIYWPEPKNSAIISLLL